MRPNSTAVLGLQWGDEGKGKIIDFLSESSDAVVRFGGGSNAGHTIVIAGDKFILRLLPSGIFRPNKVCCIGAGVACDPEVLEAELSALLKRGVLCDGRVFVDYAAHLVLPIHKERDGFEETTRGKGAIDTTRRGIGPSYADRVSRIGIRVADLFEPALLRQKAENILRFHRICTGRATEVSEKEPADLVSYLEKYRALFAPLMADVTPTVMKLIDSGKAVLFEGAQGSLLDIDYGTYPYTTSSHTTIGGIFTGLGLPPSYLGRVVGVMKSYVTRVGQGPFPTELSDQVGAQLRDKGFEFGSVTGRPRRTGWLDMVALKRMVKLNGVTQLALTKLDVLDGMAEIMVCQAYEVDGQRRDDVAPNHPDFLKAKPIHTRLEGWTREVAHKTSLAEFPPQARAYIDFIEQKTGVPILLISTGFGREDTILLD
ncbi:MAG: adenylosuccinate synthase [candidate division Zixibacteria bacterium RBG_16_53_22]|nr:MAG: adenylosuccinate synthase [candidate division Zixibacteria bacterium RBG_16_53_22]